MLLLPKMLETAEKFNTLPRLVVVSSEVHHWAKMKKGILDAANPLQVWGKESYTYVLVHWILDLDINAQLPRQ